MPTKVNSNGLLDFAKEQKQKKEPLPQMWDTQFSEEHNAEYFVNRESGETVWERPTGV